MGKVSNRFRSRTKDHLMEELKPKVCIITGYYNREDYVFESINSLLDQDYENIQVVVFDDCSSDQTFSNLNKMREKDNRVSILRNSENKGFVNSLIDIIPTLDTDFIAIHGSGDIAARNRISECINFLLANPDFGVVSSQSTLLTNKGENSAVRLKSGEITTDDVISDNPITHGAVMFRKRLYLEVGGYRRVFKFAQDKDLWLRMSLITRIYVLPKVLYFLEKPKNTVSRSIDKLIVQRMLSSFAIELIRMRRIYGYDLVDYYGINSLLFFNPKNVSKEIVRMMAIQYYLDNRKALEHLSNIFEITSGTFFEKSIVFLLRYTYGKRGLNNLISALLNIRFSKMKKREYTIK